MLADSGEKSERNAASISLQKGFCCFMHLNTFQNYIRIFTKSAEKRG
jgi:hypothetical protein